LSAFVPGSVSQPVIDPSAETATVRAGYMGGAVQSGKRAAAEASGSETS
jgi:monoamine oxidase